MWSRVIHGETLGSLFCGLDSVLSGFLCLSARYNIIFMTGQGCTHKDKCMYYEPAPFSMLLFNKKCQCLSYHKTKQQI